MLISQIIILVLITLNFFFCLNYDFNGRKSKEPAGFSGAVATVIVIALQLFLFYKAGALSLIFN